MNTITFCVYDIIQKKIQTIKMYSNITITSNDNRIVGT